MCSSWYRAENFVDALFDDYLDISDEENIEDDEDNHIYVYMESKFLCHPKAPLRI